MHTYEKSSLIECSLEALYEFHLDVSNLKVISPKNVKVTLLNEEFTPKEGALLRLKTVKNFLPITWEVRIETMNAPYLLIDVAEKSPFTFWKHSHIFIEVDTNFCELKDRVEYKLPFGFLGSLFDFYVQYELQAMFKFRHKVTQKILEEKK